MTKLMAAILTCAVLMPPLPAAIQKRNPQQTPQVRKKLEALLVTAQIPFSRSQDGNYLAVVRVAEDEPEKFRIELSYLGNDPMDERYQIVQLYFLLGTIPKGASFPPALIKQINHWNSDLTMGRVIAFDNLVTYTTSSWLAKTDAQTLSQDATLGHISSQLLRKEIAPYLKH